MQEMGLRCKKSINSRNVQHKDAKIAFELSAFALKEGILFNVIEQIQGSE